MQWTKTQIETIFEPAYPYFLVPNDANNGGLVFDEIKGLANSNWNNVVI
jgi:hypothetical protein